MARIEVKRPPMNLLRQCCLGLLALQLGLNLQAQPILVQPQNQGFGGSSLNNLRLRNLSADGTEAILTVEFNYDGVNGPSARILPVIRDKKQPNVSGWFGADAVPVSTGRGIISLRVKFFNDDPGVPPQLTTDHVKVVMLSDSGNVIISQGLFATTIRWGNTNAQGARPSPPKTQEQAALQAQAGEKAGQEARLKAEAEAGTRRQAAEKAGAASATAQAAPAAQGTSFALSSTARTSLILTVSNRTTSSTAASRSVTTWPPAAGANSACASMTPPNPPRPTGLPPTT